MRDIGHTGNNPHRPNVNPHRGCHTVHLRSQNGLKFLYIRVRQDLV